MPYVHAADDATGDDAERHGAQQVPDGDEDYVVDYCSPRPLKRILKGLPSNP